MKAPPRWDHTRLATEAAAARKIFRQERLEEPAAKWRAAFDRYQANFAMLLNEHGAINLGKAVASRIAGIFGAKLGDELRYMAGPPISADDLAVLADTTLATSVLRRDPDAAKRVVDIILQAFDPYRFPWLAQGREPTNAERMAAILASAAMLTRQRVQTDRANQGKNAQEAALKTFLVGIGFAEIPARPIPNMMNAPPLGTFCAETLVGSRKADVPVRLFDGRLMPIECKVTNSSTNSVKRLNNDAQVKAAIWAREFGTSNIVPAAVLSGVFKVHNLEQAQEGGLTLFWAHDLRPMEEFINGTRLAPCASIPAGYLQDHPSAQIIRARPLEIPVAISTSHNSQQLARSLTRRAFVHGFDVVAHELDRRFRARRAAGIVSVDSISSLVRQYVQAFERDPRESNRIFASKLKRRRGGQPGNENRRIHGYYSRDAKYLHDGIRAFEWLMRVLAADLEGHS